jgi:hypothetical protein
MRARRPCRNAGTSSGFAGGSTLSSASVRTRSRWMLKTKSTKRRATHPPSVTTTCTGMGCAPSSACAPAVLKGWSAPSRLRCPSGNRMSPYFCRGAASRTAASAPRGSRFGSTNGPSSMRTAGDTAGMNRA